MGLVITASHNPVEWNALKLLTREGMFLDEEEGMKVGRIVEKKAFRYVPWNEVGRIQSDSHATEKHIQAVLGIPFLDIQAIRRRRFRVAFDCVNGAGGTILPPLLDELNCVTFPLNPEPTGLFAHTPEPVPENLQDLGKAVRKNRAEIGFAVDPDADRLAIVSEQGEPLGEEYTISLAVQFILSKRKGTVVVNMSTTRAVDDLASRMKCPVLRTKVGEIHVAKKMKETGAVIGGEGNGGVILPEVHLGRDAPVAIVLTLQHLLEAGITVTDLWKSLPEYVMVKKKMTIGSADPDELLKMLEKNHRKEQLDLLDGIKINSRDHWVHIRKSNTEPIIRVVAEAKTRVASNAVCEQYMEEIRNIAGLTR